MLSLVYVSFATVPFSDADLDALLAKSRSNNVRDGISGMLLYRDGDFLQVLEGPEDKVRAAFERRFDPSELQARGSEAYQYLLGFRQIAS